MRTTKNFLAITALLLIALTTAQYARFASSVLRPPIGTLDSCPARWTNVLTTPNNVYTFSGSAKATFKTTSVTADGAPAGNTQELVSLTATATDPVLGTITWTSSGSTNTRIVANQLNADFPATSDIFFKPTATISSKPGVTYTGGVVHLQTTTLSTFAPQVNEPYRLIGGPVTFTGNDGTSFTLDLQNFVVG